MKFLRITVLSPGVNYSILAENGCECCPFVSATPMSGQATVLNEPHLPYEGPSRVNISDISAVARSAQLLLEELGKRLAVYVVKLLIEVIETVLKCVRKDAY